MEPRNLLHEPIAVGEDRVYVTDDKGAIWALNSKDGASVWKQEALSNRYVTGPTYFNGHLVVADFEGYVHWLDARTGKFEYREQLTEDRIIVPAIDAGGILLSYSTAGLVVAMRPH